MLIDVEPRERPSTADLNPIDEQLKKLEETRTNAYHCLRSASLEPVTVTGDTLRRLAHYAGRWSYHEMENYDPDDGPDMGDLTDCIAAMQEAGYAVVRTAVSTAIESARC